LILGHLFFRAPEAHPLHDLVDSVEHHLQLTTDRDELPAFFDAVEGFLGAAAVQSSRHLVLTTRPENVLHGLAGFLRARRIAFRAPHAGGQIVGADEDGVDAGHGEDRLRVFHSLDVLALKDDKDLLVRVGVIIVGGGSEVERVYAAAHATVADWRVLSGGDCGHCLRAAVDHGNDDAVTAVVEHALDMVVAGWGGSGQGGAPPAGGGGGHIRPPFPLPHRLRAVDAPAAETAAGPPTLGD